MRMLVEIPLRSLEDLRDWHQGQVDRFTNLKAHHETKYGPLGKYGQSVLRGDQYKIDFHQRAVDILQSNLNEQTKLFQNEERGDQHAAGCAQLASPAGGASSVSDQEHRERRARDTAGEVA
jgi:hypothetical protein